MDTDETKQPVKAKGLLPPAYLFAAILLMAGLHFLLPVAQVAPFPWDLLGAVPLGLGVALNLLADRAFKRSGTTVKPFEESHALVTDGVFRISRNPMYLGFVLILLGIAVLMGSLTPHTVVVLFAVVIDVVFVRAEESALGERFGDTWLRYKARVRRWI
jgi:protein-S-isoprenylcysteine O-methyltransferase Ste14